MNNQLSLKYSVSTVYLIVKNMKKRRKYEMNVKKWHFLFMKLRTNKG